MSERRQCLRCGSKSVLPRARPGRTIQFRTIPALPIPEDFLILTCTRCSAEYIDPETSHQLHGLLTERYHGELRRLASDAIRGLSKHISQRQLELLAGLSQGYLSRLMAQIGTPSPALVLLLSMLARDPEHRLAELKDVWQSARPLPDPNHRS